MEQSVVRVADFSAIPNDGTDDAAAISKAIAYACQHQIPVVEFEEGTYNFSQNPVGGSMQEAYLYIEGAENLTLRGQKDANGLPTTYWIRHNTGVDNVDLRQLLCVLNSKNITIENLIFDMDVPYYTACQIDKVSGKTISLTVSEGYPVPSETGYTRYHLPGLYDTKSKTFCDQRLIWTNEDGTDVPSFTIPDASNPRRIQIQNKEIAQKVKKAIKTYGRENLLFFFFQGHYTESAKMIYFRGCENLLVENVKIHNGTGFPMTCDFCRNVTYRNVQAAPKTGYCAVAPRDCFKLYCCSGDIVLDHVTMDGFEDDGQNCHGMFSTVQKVEDANTIIANLTQVLEDRPEWLLGTELRFLTPETNELAATCTVVAAEQVDEAHWKLRFKEPVPKDIVCSPDGNFEHTTVFELGAYLSDSWTIRNCRIRNTYRGLKISAKNVLCENNVFENNVYGIYMGAENDPWWHESQNPRHVVIRQNHFKQPLSGIAIDMDFHSYETAQKAPVMQEIEIYKNVFEDCATAISVKDAGNVYIYENAYKNVKQEIALDTASTKDVFLTAREQAKTQTPLDVVKRKREAKQKKIKLTVEVLASIAVVSAVGASIAYLVKKKHRS